MKENKAGGTYTLQNKLKRKNYTYTKWEIHLKAKKLIEISNNTLETPEKLLKCLKKQSLTF